MYIIGEESHRNNLNNSFYSKGKSKDYINNFNSSLKIACWIKQRRINHQS